MKVFFSVGEPSGDLHGGNLIRRLHQQVRDIECVGYGGPQMAAAGCELHEDLTQLAIMGVTQVVGHLKTFAELIRRAGEFFEQQRPDAVVLIDYPGLNWWIARHAKAHGIPVFYYGVPQMWAWGSWRVSKMRRLVDHALCKLPFEVDWYQQRQCRATYVGHPYFDELRARQIDDAFVDRLRAPEGKLITILPGSRTHEVRDQLPWFLKTARHLRQTSPDTRFAIAAYNDKLARIARQQVEQSGLAIPIHVGRTPELIQAAHSCMACSGSVSLELLYYAKPSVILYWGPAYKYYPFWYTLMTTRYITLVNLLAVSERFGRGHPYDPDAPDAVDVPLPEYPTCKDKSGAMAQRLLGWLEDETEYERRVTWLKQLRRQYAIPGASEKAADYVLQQLGVPLRPRLKIPQRAA